MCCAANAAFFSTNLSVHSKDLRGLKAGTELLVGSTSQSRIRCATQENGVRPQRVRTQRPRSQEMFVPLVHAPGEAQADFGEALVVVAVFNFGLMGCGAPYVIETLICQLQRDA